MIFCSVYGWTKLKEKEAKQQTNIVVNQEDKNK